MKRWGASLLAAAVAFSGLAVGTAANAEPAEPIEVGDATLEWGYSKYAQAGVMTPWVMSASGEGLEIVQRGGQEVSGDPAEASRTYNLAKFSGGEGSLNPVTGAGEIAWSNDAVWSVQVTSPAGAPPAMLLSNPILTIADDATGSLSFEVGATAGASMGGAAEPAVEAERVVTQTFSSVSVVDGVLSAVPDFAGVASGQGDQVAGGGSWPQAYIDQIPSSVRAFRYQTALSGLNLKKGPLPFTVDVGEAGGETGGGVEAQPAIELFGADGEPLGDRSVAEGDVITFRGSGFDPQANVPGGSGGVPIPNSQPQGVFIAFGSVASPWKPSENGPAENRTQVRANTKWALLESVMSGLAEPLQTTIRNQSVTMHEDGSFEGQIIAAEPTQLPENGAFGVYTYAGGVGTVNAEQELFVPVNFAAAGDEDTTSPQVPTTGKELVWGFKDTWRDYVGTFAEGQTVPGAGARVDDSGLFHFALADASGYDAATGEGVITYDGRIRFMSDLHGFDIVIEKPWVTFTDGGAAAVLSLGMSTTSTVGDLTVTRVDAAALTPASPEAETIDEAEHLVWNGVSGTFLPTVQPTEFSRYVGGQTDPLTFAIPAAAVDGGGADSDTGADAGAGAGASAGSDADGAAGADSDASSEGSAAASGGSGWSPAASDLTPENHGTVSVPAVATAGEPITVTVGAAYAGQLVEVYAFSTPRHLGTATVSVAGTVEVRLPSDLTGQHRIAVYTVDGALIGWDDITIDAVGTSSAKLAVTGANGLVVPGIAAGALLILGAALVTARRRTAVR